MKLCLYYAATVVCRITNISTYEVIVVQIVQCYNSNLYPSHTCIIIINTSCQLDPQIVSD